jgi:hypothetical protein
MEIEFFNANTGFLNEDQTELTVHMSPEGWDSYKQWRQDMELAAQNSNDIINEQIEQALEPLGLTLSSEDHEFDEDVQEIIYKVVKL